MTDSNYDWGQDLKRLQNFVNNPPKGEEIDKIAIDYFGGGDPEYYLGGKAVSWSSDKGNPDAQGIHWLAISVNSLQSALGKPVDGFERNPKDAYLWLQKIKNVYRPDYRIGTTIFVYKL